jgi:hypothetical protein
MWAQLGKQAQEIQDQKQRSKTGNTLQQPPTMAAACIGKSQLWNMWRQRLLAREKLRLLAAQSMATHETLA